MLLFVEVEEGGRRDVTLEAGWRGGGMGREVEYRKGGKGEIEGCRGKSSGEAWVGGDGGEGGVKVVWVKV
ncbi:hypothetical protein Pmani_017764 [Petrolisthes manimaculis]|uniref:Uncharacterized protein n=1 Tax=Petrolisthes manimaculis TaxID=1843537 RepID=A0AAE1U7F2_9EUCA|nr:hypothetical protein Pmani_017764 [Petrolisthes manimaculis]